MLPSCPWASSITLSGHGSLTGKGWEDNETIAMKLVKALPYSPWLVPYNTTIRLSILKAQMQHIFGPEHVDLKSEAYTVLCWKKCSCLNKRISSSSWWNILLQVGENWSEMSENGWKTSIFFCWTPIPPACLSVRSECLFSTVRYIYNLLFYQVKIIIYHILMIWNISFQVSVIILWIVATDTQI